VLEAAATVLCLLHGCVHPTPSGGTLDPEIPADLVTGDPRPLPAGEAAAISLNLAFGGCNAAAVLRRGEPSQPAG
jgi:3-oxoacyl-[acyl-carrier-protein] synthase II